MAIATKPTKSELRLSSGEVEKLRALEELGLLTAEAFNKWAGHSDGVGSLKHTSAVFRRLFGKGLVSRVFLPGRGFVYSRAGGGRRSPFHLEHSGQVVDFLVLLKELEHQGKLWSLRVLSERAIKTAYGMIVTTPTGERLPLYPDAWFDFSLPQERICGRLELDRGSEGREVFTAKLKALLWMDPLQYESLFGVKSRAVLFLTTKGKLRLNQMRLWAEELVEREGRPGVEWQFWRFAAFDPRRVQPEDAVFSRCWYAIGDAEPRALPERQP